MSGAHAKSAQPSPSCSAQRTARRHVLRVRYVREANMARFSVQQEAWRLVMRQCGSALSASPSQHRCVVGKVDGATSIPRRPRLNRR